jgi:hypothetical protein
MDKAELIIAALQQRIGEMAAQHELEKAMLRAEYTILQQSVEDKQKALNEYSQEIAQKAGI